MALTMTRTSTQTTLTQLVETLANLKGELAFVEAWMAEAGAPVELVGRREVLLEQHKALATTLQVFDPALAVESVAPSEGWARSLGQMRLSVKVMRARYFNTHGGKKTAN